MLRQICDNCDSRVGPGHLSLTTSRHICATCHAESLWVFLHDPTLNTSRMDVWTRIDIRDRPLRDKQRGPSEQGVWRWYGPDGRLYDELPAVVAQVRDLLMTPRGMPPPPPTTATAPGPEAP